MESTFSLIDDRKWAEFCTLQPQEAYELDKAKFCAFVRSINPSMTDEDIAELMEDSH